MFSRQCAECQQDILTEIEYPHDVPIICNVCAAPLTKQLEEALDTHLLWHMPTDVKARMIDEAHKRNMPVEEVFRQFVSWKLGRPVQASLSNKSGKKRKSSVSE